MGIFTKLLPGHRTMADALSTPLALSSPWITGSLSRVALADAAGIRLEGVDRAEAMKVPAVVRGRGLIVGHLSRLPLGLYRVAPADPTGATDVRLETPDWLTSTKTIQSPRARLAWTLDDLIFTGLSLWAAERDGAGTILDAIRVPRNEWEVDSDSLGVRVRGEAVDDPQSVILFEGIQEGLCTIAADEIKGSRDMSTAWRQRVESPVPNIALKQIDPNVQLEDDEIDDLVLDWEAARRAGGTALLPFGVDAEAMGQVAADLYVEGRNASRLDLGNYLQVPANLLEGSMATASLTYTTQAGRRSDFIDSCLAYWAQPIESRLSMDDVTPDGTAIRFDYASLTATTQPSTYPSTED